MKKNFINSYGLAFLLFLSLVLGNSTMALATPTPKPVVPVELKFAGFVQGQPLFQLDFKGSPGQDQFTVTITDEAGVALYRESLQGQVFSKKFLLNTEEIGDAMLRFEVFCRKTNSTVAYLVNRNTRVIQDVLIAEVTK